MTKTGWQNVKMLCLAVAMVLGVALHHKDAKSDIACEDCADTPVLVKETGVVAQDRFDHKDT